MSQVVIKIPTEFKPLFRDDWREAAIYGGRYSMKSHTVARYLLIKAREKKTRILCAREFQNSITDSSHQLLSDLIKKYELHDFKITDKSIVNTVTGSDFLFKGLHRNEQAVKSTEGVDIAWVEEAQTITKESIDILTPTIRKPGSKIVYTYNRLLENDPVHVRLVKEGRPNTLILNVNYDIAEKYGFLPDVIRDEIEDDKEHRPELYRHKWLGEPFADGAGFFNGVDSIIVEAQEPVRGNEYQLGIDLAKYQDFTVIAPFDLNTFTVKALDRFNQIDWNLQKARIELMYEKLNFPVSYIDSTGLGDPIYDDLINKGMKNLVSYKFTTKSRMELLENLRVLIAEQKIRLPDDPILIEELKSMHYAVSQTGKLTVKVPDGLHDDTIMAVALSVWQIPQSPKPPSNYGLKGLGRPKSDNQVVISNYE